MRFAIEKKALEKMTQRLDNEARAFETHTFNLSIKLLTTHHNNTKKER